MSLGSSRKDTYFLSNAKAQLQEIRKTSQKIFLIFFSVQFNRIDCCFSCACSLAPCQRNRSTLSYLQIELLLVFQTSASWALIEASELPQRTKKEREAILFNPLSKRKRLLTSLERFDCYLSSLLHSPPKSQSDNQFGLRYPSFPRQTTNTTIQQTTNNKQQPTPEDLASIQTRIQANTSRGSKTKERNKQSEMPKGGWPKGKNKNATRLMNVTECVEEYEGLLQLHEIHYETLQKEVNKLFASPSFPTKKEQNENRPIDYKMN